MIVEGAVLPYTWELPLELRLANFRMPTPLNKQTPNSAETPPPIPDEIKNYLAYGVSENAKQQVTAWARWIVGAFVVGFGILGLTTYSEIKTTISSASDAQIKKATEAAEKALATFETASQEELQKFKDQTKAAIKDFQATKTQAIERLRDEIQLASGEVETAKRAAIESLGDGQDAEKSEARTVDRRARVRPFGPGLSVSNLNTTAGTICCVVANEAGEKFILSAQFVLVGDDDSRKIVQPATFDGGTPGDVIAMLPESPPGLSSGATGQTLLAQSVAIAKVLDDSQLYYDVPEIGEMTGLATTTERGQTLRMYGRTTGLSVSKVHDTGFRLSLLLPVDGNSETFTFDNMILLAPFSAGGDAGAPVVNDKNELVGIHFAGSSESSVVLPVGPAFEELGLTLVTKPSE